VKVIYANQAYLRSKGATMADVIGTNARQFVGPKTDATVLYKLREALCRGEAARAEFVTYRLDGSHYYAAASAQPLVDADGKTSRYVLMLHDITESVLRGAELAMQNERLTSLTAVARGIFAASNRTRWWKRWSGRARTDRCESRLLVARPNGGFALTKDLLVPERAASGATRSSRPRAGAKAHFSTTASAAPRSASPGRSAKRATFSTCAATGACTKPTSSRRPAGPIFRGSRAQRRTLRRTASAPRGASSSSTKSRTI